jgi:DNA-binding NarL/FixJ family response regulator
MKKLIFVDDEPMVLNGLRRALHEMRQEWEMTFLDNAEVALQTLDNAEYDAIITDIRMPIMDGAQLLEQVKERHPAVMRIVLSGQSSRETVLRSIAPAHQFLSKPCDPEELKRRLKQAFAMRDLLCNESVKTLVSSLRSIPSLPALYDELTAELHGEDVSLARIANVISRDVGMAAKFCSLPTPRSLASADKSPTLYKLFPSLAPKQCAPWSFQCMCFHISIDPLMQQYGCRRSGSTASRLPL